MKIALVWPSPAEQVKEEDSLAITLTPSLSGDLTPQHGLRGQVFAQMLQITPSHRTVASDFRRPLPGPTVFQLKMPKLYSTKPVRLPISYEYEWSPKPP